MHIYAYINKHIYIYTHKIVWYIIKLFQNNDGALDILKINLDGYLIYT